MGLFSSSKDPYEKEEARLAKEAKNEEKELKQLGKDLKHAEKDLDNAATSERHAIGHHDKLSKEAHKLALELNKLQAKHENTVNKEQHAANDVKQKTDHHTAMRQKAEEIRTKLSNFEADHRAHRAERDGRIAALHREQQKERAGTPPVSPVAQTNAEPAEPVREPTPEPVIPEGAILTESGDQDYREPVHHGKIVRKSRDPGQMDNGEAPSRSYAQYAPAQQNNGTAMHNAGGGAGGEVQHVQESMGHVNQSQNPAALGNAMGHEEGLPAGATYEHAQEAQRVA